MCARERVCDKHLFTHTLTVTVRDTHFPTVCYTPCVCVRERTSKTKRKRVNRDRESETERERERDTQ